MDNVVTLFEHAVKLKCADPYKYVASKVFAVPESKVTAEQRKEVKSNLFFYLYNRKPLK